jgi:hypothetical protein
MTKTQMTTKTAVQYNSSGAAAGFGPEPHPPHQDPSAAKTIQDKLKATLILMQITKLLFLK